MKKNFTLKFIQIAWVIEVATVVLYTMFCLFLMPLDRLGLWLQFLPPLAGLIAAQGTAASIGPLVADKIKCKEKKLEE